MSYYKLVVAKTFNGFFHVEFDETLDILQSKKSLFFLQIVPHIAVMSTTRLRTVYKQCEHPEFLPIRPGHQTVDAGDDWTPKADKNISKPPNNLNINNFVSGFTLTLKFHLR